MSRFHIRRRLTRLRRARWWLLVRVTRQGFVFVVPRDGLPSFDALSWSGFYSCGCAPTVERALSGMALNRAVVNRLRKSRGRRL